MASTKKRAVGVVRVSRVGKRDGDSFVSPTEQRERIEQACKREGFKLVDVFEELDVSGGAPLSKRPGLSRAIDLIEEGVADVLVVAYFDRLVRKLEVQLEVAKRVENAGGAVIAVDVGEVGGGKAVTKLTAHFLGAIAEYQRDTIAERTAGAKAKAVARGEPPFSQVPPGYELDDDRRIRKSKQAAVVKKAFQIRADGGSHRDVRLYLREHGIVRSLHAVQKMLGSRIYLGELHFGDLVNETSHPAIIDRDLWERVQRTRTTAGRRAKSERLLARLGVLRCANCGGRMVVSQYGKGEHVYRCSPSSDCDERMTITAEIAERAVVNALKEHLAGIEGSASSDSGIAAVQTELDQIEREIAAVVEAFDGLDDNEAVRAKLSQLRIRRDAGRERLADLQESVLPALTITIDDWDDLSLDGRRALIRASVERAEVHRGRGADRVRLTYRT